MDRSSGGETRPSERIALQLARPAGGAKNIVLIPSIKIEFKYWHISARRKVLRNCYRRTPPSVVNFWMFLVAVGEM